MGNPRYRLQSLFDLEAHEDYDVVVSWGSLTFAPRARQQLLKIPQLVSRSLRADGGALFLEPVHRGLLHRVLNMDIKEFCPTMEEADFHVERVTQMHYWPMRLVLAYLPWPRILTAGGYHVGQLLLHMSNNGWMGDYKATYASVRKPLVTHSPEIDRGQEDSI